MEKNEDGLTQEMRDDIVVDVDLVELLNSGSTEVSKHYGYEPDGGRGIEKIQEIERALEDGDIRFIKDVTPRPWNDRVDFETWGLVIPEDLSREDHRSVGLSLAAMKKAVHYWVGDWIRFGVWKWGDEFFQEIDAEDWADGFISQEFGFTFKTVQNDLWVCERVDPDVRKLAPAFGYSDAVAVLPRDDQVRVLKQARRLGWKIQKVRAVKTRIRQVRGEIPVRKVSSPDPDRQFRRLVGLYLAIEDWIRAYQYYGGGRLAHRTIQKKRIRAKIIRELQESK